MRMGPFSNKKVTDFIQHNFVPLFVSNQEYSSSQIDTEERELLRAIRSNARKNGLSSGAVQVYLLTHELDVLDVMHVAKAVDVKQLMPFLRGVANELDVEPGAKVVPPRNRNRPPVACDSELALQTIARYDSGDKIVVADWLRLSKKEWQQFVPPNANEQEETWELDDALTKKMLVHFYPYAQNWDLDPKQFLEASLNANVIERSKDETVVGLRGKLLRTHARYVKSGREMISSKLVGFVRIRTDQKLELILMTSGATYGALPFQGMLQTVVNPDS